MTFPLSGGDTTMVITLDDIREYVIGKTLADEPVPEGGLVLRAIAKQRVAHDWDVNPDHIELQTWDSMHVMLSRREQMLESLDAWEVDFLCLVWCDECETVATHQTNFSANLCLDHFKVAMDEWFAELEADDYRAGMR